MQTIPNQILAISSSQKSPLLYISCVWDRGREKGVRGRERGTGEEGEIKKKPHRMNFLQRQFIFFLSWYNNFYFPSLPLFSGRGACFVNSSNSINVNSNSNNVHSSSNSNNVNSSSNLNSSNSNISGPSLMKNLFGRWHCKHSLKSA